MRNDGKDLEGYSRDRSIISRSPDEAILKYTILPFTAAHKFVRFSTFAHTGLTKS